MPSCKTKQHSEEKGEGKLQRFVIAGMDFTWSNHLLDLSSRCKSLEFASDLQNDQAMRFILVIVRFVILMVRYHKWLRFTPTGFGQVLCHMWRTLDIPQPIPPTSRAPATEETA